MRLPTHRPPVHPGEILLEEYIKPNHLTQAEVARKIGISAKVLSAVVHAKRPLDTELALRLGRLFGTTPELWLNGQIAWDIWHTLRSEMKSSLDAIEPLSTVNH
jgi:antitoxin HigA-1